MIAELCALLLHVSGLPYLVRSTLARRGVAILLYHDPEPTAFERHLAYLKRHYSLIPFHTVLDALESGDWSKVPTRSVVIHLDDGYRRNFELVPICVRHGVRPTLYLCSHIAATHRRFWSTLRGGRAKQLRLLDHRTLLAKLRAEADFTPEREYPERQALSLDEIRSMSSRMDFQSHGRFHFSVLGLDDATLESDLLESRARVEELSGARCEHFSFPFGDHGARERAAVRRCGYRTARTTVPGWVRPGTDRFRLPILADIPGEVSVNVLRAHLTGIPRLLKRIGYLVLTQHLYALRQHMIAHRRFF
jgi:peptidoglycan/xylan/chitin deacetylase (PgdA/CDA1 family)